MRAQVARQGAWALGASCFVLAAQTATTACLARWLLPSDFGSVALVSMLASLAAVLSQLGLGAALVQAERVEPRDSAAVLGVALGVGLALAASIALLAPWLGGLFSNPALPALLRVYAITLVLGAATGVGFGLLQRKLAFSVLARLQVVSALLYGFVAIALAAGGAGVWSIVIGRVVADASLVGPVLWLAGAPLRPRLDPARARRFLRFGGPLTGAQLLLGAGAHLDTAIVGAAAGAAALGHYSIAFGLVMVPAARLASVVKRVAFAALSRTRSDPTRDPAGFETHAASLLLHLAVLCTPLVLGLGFVAPDAMGLLLGPGWDESAVLLRCLAPAGVVGALGSGMGAIVLARGHASVELGFAALRIPVMGSMIGIGVWLAGARGAALAVSGYHIFAFPLFYLVLCRWGGMGAGVITRAIAPGIVAALAMAGPVSLTRDALAEAAVAVRLTAAVTAGAASYALVLGLLFPRAWHEVRLTLGGLIGRGAPRLAPPGAPAEGSA